MDYLVLEYLNLYQEFENYSLADYSVALEKCKNKMRRRCGFAKMDQMTGGDCVFSSH